MFGLSVGLPSARRLARHRHLAAIPASMQASEEPMAEVPTVLAASGAFHRSAIMCTHRRSISAVCGYSSRSIMFLLIDSAIRPMNLGFLPRLAERGQVLPGVPIEHQLIRHQLERIPGQRPVRGEPVLSDRPGQVPVGEHAVLELVTDGITLVQRHSQHLLDQGRSAPGSRGIAPLSGRRRTARHAGGTARQRRHPLRVSAQIPGQGSLLSGPGGSNHSDRTRRCPRRTPRTCRAASALS